MLRPMGAPSTVQSRATPPPTAAMAPAGGRVRAAERGARGRPTERAATGRAAQRARAAGRAAQAARARAAPAPAAREDFPRAAAQVIRSRAAECPKAAAPACRAARIHALRVCCSVRRWPFCAQSAEGANSRNKVALTCDKVVLAAKTRQEAIVLAFWNGGALWGKRGARRTAQFRTGL